MVPAGNIGSVYIGHEQCFIADAFAHIAVYADQCGLCVLIIPQATFFIACKFCFPKLRLLQLAGFNNRKTKAIAGIQLCQRGHIRLQHGSDADNRPWFDDRP